MKLIRTHDGLVGIQFTSQGSIIWVDDYDQLIRITQAHFAKMEMSHALMHGEISTALDHMLLLNHEVAQFGVFGSFMYTEAEVA